MIRYPVAIEPGTRKTAFGVVVPDLPGRYAAGDTLDEAMVSAEEAAALWIDAAARCGPADPAAVQDWGAARQSASTAAGCSA